MSVLVGAGIGVTPYASILKDFVHMSSIRSMYKVKCQKVSKVKVVVCTYFRARIHLKFEHTVLGTTSAVWAVCLGQ